MPTVAFAPALTRHVACPPQRVEAPTLRGALDAAFRAAPALRGYVLDDQGHLRANVVVFIDGQRNADRIALSDPLADDSTVHVLQALSGG